MATTIASFLIFIVISGALIGVVSAENELLVNDSRDINATNMNFTLDNFMKMNSTSEVAKAVDIIINNMRNAIASVPPELFSTAPKFLMTPMGLGIVKVIRNVRKEVMNANIPNKAEYLNVIKDVITSPEMLSFMLTMGKNNL